MVGHKTSTQTCELNLNTKTIPIEFTNGSCKVNNFINTPLSIPPFRLQGISLQIKMYDKV